MAIKSSIITINKRCWFLNGIAVLIATVCMFYFSFFLLDRVVLYGDDSIVTIQFYSLLKTVILGKSNSPSGDSIILINTAYDNQLVNFRDPVTGTGNRAITDRRKLEKLFKLLNKNKVQYKYIVCNIFFEDELPIDIALAHEMEKMNLIIPYLLDDKNKAIYPNSTFRHINMGVSQYEASEDLFVKFRYSYLDQKTIPVKMYEDIHREKYTYDGDNYKRNGKHVLNNTVIDFRVRHYDIFESKKYHIINLGELLQLSETDIVRFLSNKLILIGDFVTGYVHKTLVGDMSGSILLLNAYFALAQGDNIMHWGFSPFIFFAYLIISIKIFMPITVKNALHKKYILLFIDKLKIKFKKVKYIKHVWPIFGFVKLWLFTDILALLIISSLSYLMFGIHINIIYLSIFVVTLDYAVRLHYAKYFQSVT